MSFRSFNEIKNNLSVLLHSFKEKPEFWAHIQSVKNPETLYEHTSLVLNYFLKIIEIHGIEPVIDKLINHIPSISKKAGNFIKELFFLSVLFHDFGKTNPNFQVEKMNNRHFKKDKRIKIGSEHSFLSAYFFMLYCVETIAKLEFSRQERIAAYYYTFLFATPILKHHSGFIQKDYDFSEEKIESIHYLSELLNLNLTKEHIMKLVSREKSEDESNLSNAFKSTFPAGFDFFPIFVLLKLNYSLLTASDYLATSEYMNDLKLITETDFGLLTNDLKKELIENFDYNKSTPWNGEIITNPNKYLSKNLDELCDKSNENLNFIRQKMGAEVLTNIEKYRNEKVFYIEAPTGGGKTNMSMIAVRKMLELHPEINKVFYVFPFTTLITQTAKSIKETFGLTDSDIALLHSKSGFQEKDYGNETDARYGRERRNQIDNLFVNYPFVLLTHIKFFDVLKSNRKETNYLLHRLANSVVIIDELQAYAPKHWDKIKYFIDRYSELFNIRFVIMSATLPKIDEIIIPKIQEITSHSYNRRRFIPLLENSKKYLQNPNFAGRVIIKTELLTDEIELEKLADILLEKSKDYSENRKDGLGGSVYTVIEFIFKKSASTFYDIISGKNDFFDEIFVLSGTILEPRRKYIIEFLKDKENRKKKVLLITTQVVEAGVDIDMDLGFKNQSLIDSDEQLAGRINRNVNKQNCELYLFKHDKPKYIYRKDLRFKVTQEFSNDFVKDILTKKEFGELYKRVIDQIEKINNSPIWIGINDYLSKFERFDFKGAQNDFKLIDSQNVSIFVPVEINVKCYRKENNFSDNEIECLKKHQCITGEKVSGEKVWTLYLSFVNNPEKKFSVEHKILSGIMSKFVFSVFMRKAKDLYPFLENNEINEQDNYQGYLKLREDKTDEIYTLESGINESYLEELTNSEFEFI